MEKPKIILADDHALVAEGLTRLLEPEFEVVLSVSNGRDLLAAMEHTPCDLVLLDVSMPLLNGIDAGRMLKSRYPGVKLLFLSVHTSADYMWEAFRAGASGYMLKRSSSTELKTAITRILRGETYIGPAFASHWRARTVSASPAKRPLTTRQREVVQLLAEGHSGKQIAAALHISPKTVEFHKATIQAHLGLHSTAEIIRYAMEHRIIPDSLH